MYIHNQNEKKKVSITVNDLYKTIQANKIDSDKKMDHLLSIIENSVNLEPEQVGIVEEEKKADEKISNLKPVSDNKSFRDQSIFLTKKKTIIPENEIQ